VATPIGNLADVSLRALEVLRGVPLVAAEDTRLTRRLWLRHGIRTRLVSYHAGNLEWRGPQLLEHLRGGSDLALVTDAGTPLVSDPGEGIVAGWIGEGGRVVPVPGPSAVLAALVASGLPSARWSFEGFLPRRGRERAGRLSRIASDDRATVVFESPGRAAATLRDLAEACGGDRRAALCRELTKVHEEVRRGTLAELAQDVAAKELRGEVTIVVGPAPPEGRSQGARERGLTGMSLDEARARVDELVAAGQSRSAAARTVADETGYPRRELFRTRTSG
jgi:16S rRNA (cytidine1402-2'-O)-methyltransferase